MLFYKVILTPVATSSLPARRTALPGRRACHRRRLALPVVFAGMLPLMALAACQSAAPMKPDTTAARRIEAAKNAKPMTPEEEAETMRKLQELQASRPMEGMHRLDPTGLSSLAAAKRDHAKMQAMQGDIDRLMVMQRNRAVEMCRSRPDIKECAELLKALQQ